MNTDPLNTNPRPSTWPRVLHIGIFAILFNLAGGALSLIVLVQLLKHIATGRSHPGLEEMGGRLARWMASVVLFLTYASDELPFPLDRRQRACGPSFSCDEA